MEKLETEVKFYLGDIQLIRKCISDLGARSRGRFFEKNLKFEDKQKTLKTDKNLDFGDVTFDNFKNIDADIADYLNVIEVHGGS